MKIATFKTLQIYRKRNQKSSL